DPGPLGPLLRAVGPAAAGARPVSRYQQRRGRRRAAGRLADEPRPGLLRPEPLPGVDRRRRPLALAMAAGDTRLLARRPAAGPAEAPGPAPPRRPLRRADPAGRRRAPGLPVDRPAGAAGGGRPASAAGL